MGDWIPFEKAYCHINVHVVFHIFKTTQFATTAIITFQAISKTLRISDNPTVDGISDSPNPIYSAIPG